MSGPTGADAQVFSQDRVRRLKIVMMVVAVVAVLVTADFLLLAATDDDRRSQGVFGVVSGVVLGSVSLLTLRLLPGADLSAKRWTLGTGILAVVVGILLLGSWSSFLLPLLGIAVIFLALINDDPDAVS